MQSIHCKTLLLLLLPATFILLAAPAPATVEWNMLKRLKLEASPLDMAVSLDNMNIFVLTDKGDILIYDPSGKLEGSIHVGAHINGIRVGPRGEKLFAISRADKTVEVIAFDFIRPINTLGAPFKGPLDAPVTIAVFSDFQ